MNIEYSPKEFPLHKPSVDPVSHRSDLMTIYTNDGQMDVAVYDKRTNLWYSLTDPTGFGVKWFAKISVPEHFEYSKELLDLLCGEGDYEIKSRI